MSVGSKTLGLFGFITAFFFACGAPNGAKPQNPINGASYYGDNLSGATDTTCTEYQCERLPLTALTGSGGGSLLAYVNQPTQWSIRAATNPESYNRQLLIKVEGGPAQCIWSNAGANSTCSITPTTPESNTTPIKVYLVDTSYCQFVTRQRGGEWANINCQDIDRLRSVSGDIGFQESQVSYSIADAIQGIDPQSFVAPQVKDNSTQMCFLSALGPVLQGLVGGNLLGGVTGGVTGCVNGMVTSKQQQMMMNQQLQQMHYQQNFGAGGVNQYQQQPYY